VSQAPPEKPLVGATNAYATVKRRTDGVTLATLQFHRLVTSSDREIPEAPVLLHLDDYPTVHDAMIEVCRNAPPDFVRAGFIRNLSSVLLRPLATVGNCLVSVPCDAAGVPAFGLPVDFRSDGHFRGRIEPLSGWVARYMVDDEVIRSKSLSEILDILLERFCHGDSAHETLRLRMQRAEFIHRICEAWNDLKEAAPLPYVPAEAAMDDLVLHDAVFNLIDLADGGILGYAWVTYSRDDRRWRAGAARRAQHRTQAGADEHFFDQIDSAIAWVAQRPPFVSPPIR
jgi:hypothetical protein